MTYKIEGFSRRLPQGTRFFANSARDAVIKRAALQELCAPDGTVIVHNNGVEITVVELERLARNE